MIEKSITQDKHIKIHQLKGKPKTNNNEKPTYKCNQQLREVSLNSKEVYPMTKPIIIRYIDPRLVPLFQQLGNLKNKCEQLAQQSQHSSATKNKENIEVLLQSTKKLSEQVNQIMQDNAVNYQKPTILFQKQPEFVDSQIVSIQKIAEEQNASIPINEKEAECLNIIEMVSSATQRIDELQQQNLLLKCQLLAEKDKAAQLQQNNNEMQMQRQRMQEQRKQIMINLKKQLFNLKEDKFILKEDKLNLMDNIDRLANLYQQ